MFLPLLALADYIPRSVEYGDVSSTPQGLVRGGILMPAALQRQGLSWSCLGSLGRARR